MKNSEFKKWLKTAEIALMKKSSQAMNEGWDVSVKSLTKILEAIDKLKEARYLA